MIAKRYQIHGRSPRELSYVKLSSSGTIAGLFLPSGSIIQFVWRTDSGRFPMGIWRRINMLGHLAAILPDGYFCLFVSSLSHFWLIRFFTYTCFINYVSLCQAILVQSHQTAKFDSSYSHMRCPGIGCWFSDRSSCSTGVLKPLCCLLSLTFTMTNENLSLYITLLHYWSLHNYAAHAADTLTLTTTDRSRAHKDIQCLALAGVFF